MHHNAVLGRRDRQTGSQAGEDGRKWQSGSRELEWTSVGCAKPRPDTSEARGHALPGACSAVYCVALAGEHWGDSQQPPALSLSGGRERGWIAGDWRVVAGTQGCRQCREREAPVGLDEATGGGSTVLGPTYLRGCLFWSGWLMGIQEQERVPWIVVNNRSTSSAETWSRADVN